jgi:hypothetical protein
MACCWIAGGAIALISPAAFFVELPMPAPVVAGGLVLVGVVLCAAGQMIGRSLRQFVVAREGIFISSQEEVTGARWEGIVDARVTKIGTKPYLLIQKGGRADNVERLCLSSFDASPEDLDLLLKSVSRDEARRAALPEAARSGVDLKRLRP